jgi:hypothetical protein
MKKILILFVITTCLLFQACSQNVPTSVKNAFATKFPKATQVKWSKEKSLTYEAEFKLNGAEMSANFDEKGSWTETEIEITEQQLPDTIKKALKSNFNEFKIDEISTLEEAGKELKYELAVNKNGETIELIFSIGGTLLDKKAEKEVEKKDKEDKK